MDGGPSDGKVPGAGTTPEPSRAFGPRGIGGLIARVTRPGFRRRSPAAIQIMTDWMEILGPDLGARTVPQKLSAGTLTIACAGPTAMELQHFAPQLLARINGHVGGYGDKAPIQRLRFVQQASALPGAIPPRPSRTRAARPPPEIDLQPGPLKDALLRLAQAMQDRRE
jgi:hypothetical protein